MSSEPSRYCLFAVSLLFVLLSVLHCSTGRNAGRALSSGGLSLSLPSEEEYEQKREEIVNTVVSDSSRKEGPIIMNAIRDDETGEMVATDVIRASKVTARFRHVAERFGKLSLEFDICVPEEMTDSRWQLRFHPQMSLMGESVALDPVLITGSRYRDAQLRGYQRYNAFLASIISDSLAFIYLDQLEFFLRRNFPDTYAMKTDSSVVAEPLAESLFGVTQRQALEHYTKKLLYRRNERRKSRRNRMYEKYVKAPLVTQGIRLDTVIRGDSGLVYRYVQELQSRPGLRRIELGMEGSAWSYGKKICDLPHPDGLVFYVSSLSSLADGTSRYMTRVIERNAYDRTLALIDFAQGRSEIDSSLGCNAAELRRIERNIAGIFANPDFELDSMVVSASCSPEGSYRHNSALAAARARSMREYLSVEWIECAPVMRDSHVPENWERLQRLIASDSLISASRKTALLELIGRNGDPDRKEKALSAQPEYRYLREKIYPQLRTVQLEFYTHRAGMIKDTIHTTELDTVYMSGVEAIRQLDYETAVRKLRPYRDYNAALALVSLSYNHSALDILAELDETNARVWYLRAVALSRLERFDEAYRAWQRSVELDGAMLHRGNLDPEIAELGKRYAGHTY